MPEIKKTYLDHVATMAKAANKKNTDYPNELAHELFNTIWLNVDESLQGIVMSLLMDWLFY
jgi:hypothetical protein